MRAVENTSFLAEDDKIRISFTVHKKQILKFVVQYYALIGSHWKTIVRADNCHGFGHIHKYYLHRQEYKIKLGIEDNNKAFNEAKLLVKRDFLKLKENFFRSK